MRAAEIMTSPVVTVHPDASVHDAAALMSEHRIASLPVVDDDGRVIGIVSEIDVVRDRMPHEPRSHLRPLPPDPITDPARRVRTVMTETVACVGENADAADVAAIMSELRVRAIPVVEGATIVGIISHRDLLRALLRPDIDIAEELTQRLDDLAGEAGRWRATVDDGIVHLKGRFDDDAQRDGVLALAKTVPGVLRVHLG